MAVDQDRALAHIVEATQQADDGRLARAGWADQGDGLAGLGGQVDLLQHRLACLVCKAHIVERDLALDLGQRFGVRQIGHRRLVVQHLEDALGPGQR